MKEPAEDYYCVASHVLSEAKVKDRPPVIPSHEGRTFLARRA